MKGEEGPGVNVNQRRLTNSERATRNSSLLHPVKVRTV